MSDFSTREGPTRRQVYFTHGDGAVLAPDVAFRFYEALGAEQPAAVSDQQNKRLAELSPDLGPSVSALIVVAGCLTEAANARTHVAVGRFAFDVAHHVTTGDRNPSQNFATFEGGIGDMPFPLHFVPAVAVSLAHYLVAAELMTAEQMEDMTLADWADIIDTPWFRDIIHDLALTKNGLYGTFGHSPNAYELGSFDEMLRQRTGTPVTDVFRTHIETDDAGSSHTTIKLSSELRHLLREIMRQDRSPGCPAARHAGSLTIEALGSAHAQAMIQRGNMTTEPVNETHGSARYRMEQTPIDVAMSLLAGYLRAYHAQFGTPGICPPSAVESHSNTTDSSNE